METRITPVGLAVSWGDLAPRIVAITANKPALLRRLVMASHVSHHAVAAWLHANPCVDAEKAGAVLETTLPRYLLVDIAGDATRILFRTLGKLARMKVYDASMYRRLRDLATSDLAPGLVHVAQINERRVDALETLLAVGAREPLIRTLAPRLVNAGGTRIRALADGLVVLRRLGLLGADKVSALSRAKNIEAMLGMIARTLNRAALPGLGVKIPAGTGLRSIATLGELRALGLRFRNCLRWNLDLLEAAILGRKAFFEYMAGAEPIVLALDVVKPSIEGGTAVVCIDQIKGIDNADVDPQTSKAIMTAIASIPGIGVMELGFDQLMCLTFAAAGYEYGTNDIADPDEDPMEEMSSGF